VTTKRKKKLKIKMQSTSKSCFRVLILLLAGLLSGLLTLPQASACNVPVFRYALERWPADAYRVVVHRGAPASVEPLLKAMEKSGANVESRAVDLADPLDASAEAIWKTQNNPPLPWMVVFYPAQSMGTERIAWAGALTSENIGVLTNSPSRKTIAQRLMRGDSAVWMLLESGDKVQDDRVAAMLDETSRKMEKDLALPQPDANDPKINDDVPLKVAFSTCRISRGNASERLFIETVLHLDDDLKSQTGPMVIPVFGRGRLLSILTEKTITQNSLEQIGEFLVGPCSCEVKAQNRGMDLLIAANWDESPTSPAMNAPVMPPLVGMSQSAATSNTASTAGTGTIAPSPPASPFVRLNYALGTGLIILAAGVGILWFFLGNTMKQRRKAGADNKTDNNKKL